MNTNGYMGSSKEKGFKEIRVRGRYSQGPNKWHVMITRPDLVYGVNSRKKDVYGRSNFIKVTINYTETTILI